MNLKEDVLKRIKEHEEGIERGERVLHGLREQAASMQQQAQSIGIDIERRRGALLDLRALIGRPLDGSAPKEENSVGPAAEQTA